MEGNDQKVAIVSAILGAVAVTIPKLLQFFSRSRKLEMAQEAELRDEARKDLRDLRAENARLRTEADDWRGKYYNQAHEIVQLKTQIAKLDSKVNQLLRELHGESACPLPSSDVEN